MAEPTKKSRGVERVLYNLLGGNDRRQSIRSDVCVAAPIGCGNKALEFKDELSKREYAISGFCQDCQDNMFGA